MEAARFRLETIAYIPPVAPFRLNYIKHDNNGKLY